MTRWLGLAAVVLILDQLSKLAVVYNFHYAQRLPVLPFFDLTLLYNRGAAFSFLAQENGWQRGLLIAIAVAAIFIILWLMHRHRGQKVFLLSLALILGGAAGNLIDRVVLGHVVDFVLLHWRDWYYPAFNVADMAITAGAALLFVDEWRRWRQQKRAQKSSQNNTHDTTSR